MPSHIELFAGCGGLNLGLSKAGFNLTLANELSAMAAESFAFNFFNENLEQLAKANEKPSHTYWIKSQFNDLGKRLRENPFSYPDENSEGYSNLPSNWEELKGKLLVGNIIHLNQLLDKNPKLVDLLRTDFGQSSSLDLVSGGPPCQSFSLAGLRKRDCDKNTLPWEFAKFVKHTQPKIALLENVIGILRPFKDDNGNSFHAWFEVSKVFASIGYIPLCLLVNAKLAGIPQNRPRFILIAIHHEHYQTIKHTLNDKSKALFEKPEHFFNQINSVGENSVTLSDLDFIDAEKNTNAYKGTFLEPLVSEKEVTVKETLDDLKINNPSKPSEFIEFLNKTFNQLPAREKIHNHDQRANGDLVKRRFRLYQILRDIDDRSVTKAVFSILKSESKTLPKNVWLTLKNFKFLLEDNELASFNSKDELEDYLLSHPTKKQTQKALVADKPAPTALSVPDDACHYDEKELRVLTVREMARIQSFPDNFVFRSKTTTGGQMRKFEVPQYTQVGNAVPPLLGLALGQCLKTIL